MMGPCIDGTGQLRGLVILQNKKSGQPIDFQDRREFENLLPIMAETIKQADEVKYVNDVSANVKLCLSNSKEHI